MANEPYRTESLDLAAWLMAHGHDLVDVEKLTSNRHKWVLDDSEGEAARLANKFANSVAADVLDKRKRLITISRSGRYDSVIKGR
jgi:hypothetical protein